MACRLDSPLHALTDAVTSLRRSWCVGVKVFLLAPVLVLSAACGDALGAGGGQTGLVLVPEFGAFAVFADNADRLRIVVTRVADAQLVADTTVGIDAESGEASAAIRVPLSSASEAFEVRLQAIRNSDSMVLFEGVQTVIVTATSGSTPIEIPVTYAGPTGALLLLEPADTAIAPGASFTYRPIVLDTLEAPASVPVTFVLAVPADSTILTVNRYSGLVAAGTANTGTVRVVARTPDGLADTARVSVGAVPAAIDVTPGFETVGSSATVTLAATLVDGSGTAIGPATATWTSRTPSVATVSGTGLVTGVASGIAVIVGTSGTFSDSMLVRVAAPASVPASAIADDEAFRSPAVGDTVVVDVRLNMFFSGGELLGSYNAQLTWNAAQLRYVDVQPGGFGSPTINDTQVQQGSFRFSAANAQGVAGSVVVARVRFVAQATGSAAPQLLLTEVSAAQTFTNLLSSVVVTNGSVTVRP